MQEILIVDDNVEILTANMDHLTGQGFSVTCAQTGIKAFAALNEKRYDCIILDVLLPDLDGFTICKAARTITDTPVLFLSCLDEPDDKVKGLMSGGDDYMTKPYSLKELTARVLALIRRSENKNEIRKNLYIDYENKIIRANGKNVLLSEKEFNLFLLFFENPDKIISKEDILSKVWHENTEPGAVAVLVLKLRRKIEFAENEIGRIESSYGTGYYLTLPGSETRI